MSWPWDVDRAGGYFGDRYEDVKFERVDGWLSGFMWGVVLGALICALVGLSFS